MRAAQNAAVSVRSGYIRPTHDFIATEEGQSGRQKGQRTMTACLTGTVELNLINTPPLSRYICTLSARLTSIWVLFSLARAYWNWNPGPNFRLDALNLGVTGVTVPVSILRFGLSGTTVFLAMDYRWE